MNFGQDTINWAKIDEIGQQVQSTTNRKIDNSLAKTIFAKFPQGTHRLRQIPVGNPLDGIPFMEIGQHTARIPYQGTMITLYQMCWRFILENFLSKTTQEEKRDNTLLGHLTKKEKINQQETDKFQEFGCPFCKFHEHLVRYGADKLDSNKLFTKFQYLWNIIWKFDAMNGTGDNKLYVWGQSKQHFNTLIENIRRDKRAGIYTLDPNTGFDVFWTARGDGQARRYDAPSYDRVGSPLLLGDQVPYNLADVMTSNFKSYQDMVNLMKKGYGNLIEQFGYTIPGDMTIGAQLANPVPMHPVVQGGMELNQQMQNQFPNFNIPQQATNVPVPTSNRKELPGGYYQENGKLYDPTGKELF